MLEDFYPGYFAMVMATGVLAIGAHLMLRPPIDDVLFIIAVLGYAAIAAITVARLMRFPAAFVRDLTGHAEGFAFTTFVAASNILGGAAAVLYGWWALARVLWIVGIVTWLVLLYISLIGVVLRRPKPGLARGINGTWFLLTVSTESIVALGALLLRHQADDLVAFICVALFLLGIVLYLIVMTMVFLRWTITELKPTDAEPPVWIATGAVAITTLAGVHLLVAGNHVQRVERIRPTLEVLVIMAWATATFWLPLVVAIVVWRHAVRRVPIRYDPSWWAIVFPLGMYSVASYRMDQVVGLPSMHRLPVFMLLVALAVWTLSFVGLVCRGIFDLEAVPSQRFQTRRDQRRARPPEGGGGQGRSN